MLAVLSSGIIRIPALEALLGAQVARAWPFLRNFSDYDAVVGWGRRKTADKARRFAHARRIANYLCLEDGFLRSVEFGRAGTPLSMVVDDLGIFYDATVPSRLEALTAAAHTPAQRQRAGALIAAWREARVSKYNHLRDPDIAQLQAALGSPYVLVADQTLKDASIGYGLANRESFTRMLNAALSEYPEAKVVLKVHPAVMAGEKKGHFKLAELASHPRIVILGEDVHPAPLIEHAQAVYAVTSQIGFEGLLWGKPVRTFGMPFYAGWGLTEDDLAAPPRRRPVALEDLVHAALVEYSRYVDPESGRRCEPERLIGWMGLQRRMRERFPAELFAIGFSSWKRPIVKQFFQGSTVRFVKRADAVPPGATLIVWGMKALAGKPRNDVDLVRVEDGFLRSVGLGAELVAPLSWVADDAGIYYDAATASRLETMIESAEFDEDLLRRAVALRAAICAGGITKYNVGADSWDRPSHAAHVILVPGQVESDASIRCGAVDIRRNLDLLKAVRAANPQAYIVYKPHPDVRAALRDAGAGEDQAPRWSDEIVGDVPFDRLLSAVDEVHVLTSLAGFEALLRGKKVVCHGLPFYAGWGLTYDRHAHPRRRRRINLDQLVAAVLILYPAYLSRATGKFTTPEQALEELKTWRGRESARRPAWRRLLAPLLRKN